jgi:LPXTG-site transpeptidase (sortase) family protein
MNSKISLPWSLAVLVFVAIACSSIIVFFVNKSQPPFIIFSDILIPPVQSIVLPKKIIAGIPVRMMIPSINIDAAIEYVGLTSNGAMAVPKGPNDVGWFELGPRPGDIGSAVIAGHDGWKDGIPAVFDNLSKLVAGDKIYVKDDTGATTLFVVRKVVIYGENDDASTIFDSNDGTAHLNLITCEGFWNAATQSYSSRLVVFTDKKI